jgi:hypothetical protein
MARAALPISMQSGVKTITVEAVNRMPSMLAARNPQMLFRQHNFCTQRKDDLAQMVGFHKIGRLKLPLCDGEHQGWVYVATYRVPRQGGYLSPIASLYDKQNGAEDHRQSIPSSHTY